jgi:hypothetical protein
MKLPQSCKPGKQPWVEFSCCRSPASKAAANTDDQSQTGNEGEMRAILFAAMAIGCGAAAPVKPLHDHYVVLQKEYYARAANPYGFTSCGVSYARLHGIHDRAKTLAVSESQFVSPGSGATQNADTSQMFSAGGDWAAAIGDAIKASKPYQKGALSFDGCPAIATVRTLLVAYQQEDPAGTTVLAVRCETAAGAVTGGTTAASTYLGQLMRGAVPTCAAIDGADFSTMPIQGE